MHLKIFRRPLQAAARSLSEVRVNDQALARSCDPLDSSQRPEVHTEGSAVAGVSGETVLLQIPATRFGSDLSKV